jgi:hypothetical protein
MNILQNLTQPVKTKDKLIRVGHKRDGGYIINLETINQCKRCYSYGIDNEISFERHLKRLNPHVKIHGYDHTIQLSNQINTFQFHQEGLSGQQGRCTNTFFNHIKQNKDNKLLSNTILKIDAEGAEYDFFYHSKQIQLLELRCMIVEFHNINTRLNEFLSILKELRKIFDIIHVHGNTSRFSLDYNGFEFPDTPEITFLNRTYTVGHSPLKIKYPINGLDFPNEPQDTLIKIDYL